MTKKEPKRLADIIRQIRLCKTQDEVRKFIKQECALIRYSFRQEQSQFRRRNILKMMYIHMLGYPTHFAQIECLNLLNMDSFVEKRVGYLGLTILMDGSSKVLMMATNVLLNDLQQSNEYIACLALTALATLGSEDVMFRDTLEVVAKLMKSDQCHIRKKALVCGLRAVQCGLTSNCAEFYKACAAVVTKNATDHGSLITSIQLLIVLVKLKNSKPNWHKKCLRDLRGDLVRHLKTLTSSAYELSHDINGVNDPFLHVYILRLLGLLAVRGDAAKKSDHQKDLTKKLEDLLPVVATHVSSDGFTKNPQLAVQAEIAQTILNAELPPTLVTLALNTMGNWLISNKSNSNSRYIALKTMQKLVSDTTQIQRHRKTILECLADQDPSIRYRALDLVPYIVDDKTRTEVVDTLVRCLEAPEEAFHEKVVEEIVKALKQAPDEETIFKMLEVLTQVKSVPNPDVIWHVLHRVQNTNDDLRKKSVEKMWSIVSEDAESSYLEREPLMEVVIWCLGEFGGLVAQHQQGIVELMASVLVKAHCKPVCQSLAVMALAKLWKTFPQSRELAASTIRKYTDNSVLELQCRAVEYDTLLQQGEGNVTNKVFEPMPPYDLDRDIDEEEDTKEQGAIDDSSEEEEEEDDEEGSSSSSVSSSSDSDDSDDARSKKKRKKRKQKEKEVPKAQPEKLQDLLLPGPGGVPQQASTAGAAPPAAAPQEDLLDLLGLGPSLGGAPSQPSGQQQAPPADNLLADLMGGLGTGAQAAGGVQASTPATSSGVATPQHKKVYSKNGIGIMATYHPSPRPGVVRITASTVNETRQDTVTGYSLSVAVPKYITRSLLAASGSTLPPGGAPVTQKIELENSQFAQGKATVIMIRVVFTGGDGTTTTDTATINL